MLENQRITLVPLDAAEVSLGYVSWLNDPAVFRFLGTKFGQTRASVVRYVESFVPPNVLCKIVVKEQNRHVGNIALHMYDSVHRHMEIGILIGPEEARGKGYGRDACELLIRFGFEHLNLHKITAGTVIENVAMTKVFLGLGFQIEGTLVEQYYLDGRYLDVLRFGLLAPNFRPKVDVAS